ncbi:MAG TPA: glutamate 5-kinase [Kiritimatiellia bacterium]|nr:glutamate 5-kinase [Kiritimatiellia bacterium]HRZ13522.1 glutamate 5-kinase [Kiritimatiellia bacterium]HSA19173.1 glutamate 5-kinase [Kiritimatiellia bacterium]
MRATFGGTRRVVVKIGSRVLVQRDGRPDLRRLRALVGDLAVARRAGREIVVVSSGAIGAGMSVLGLKTRPTHLPDLQMAAAVGQSRLMAIYDRLFAEEKCRVGQVLLTHADLNDRQRHLNARNTMMNLLRHGIIPIVNENDVVSVDEIKFGDNDLLASLVALLIQADLLILLTTVDGFRAPAAGGRTRRVPFLKGVSEKALALAVGKGSELSTGGMMSKLQAADTVAGVGTPVVIANGRQAGAIGKVLAGDDIGTLLAAGKPSGLSGRKRWIAFFHKAKGSLVVDDGARLAVVEKGRSLLPIGVKAVEGEFEAGDVVNIRAAGGPAFARGVTDYSSGEVRRIQGRKTSEIAAILGAADFEEVVHRDNMVVLQGATRGTI